MIPNIIYTPLSRVFLKKKFNKNINIIYNVNNMDNEKEKNYGFRYFKTKEEEE